MDLLFSNFKECLVRDENDKKVMVSNIKPTFDLENKEVIFPTIIMANGLLDRYINEIFVLEFIEDKKDEISLILYNCNIEDYGKLSFYATKDGNYALVEKMKFKYEEIKDYDEFAEALEISEIEELPPEAD